MRYCRECGDSILENSDTVCSKCYSFVALQNIELKERVIVLEKRIKRIEDIEEGQWLLFPMEFRYRY